MLAGVTAATVLQRPCLTCLAQPGQPCDLSRHPALSSLVTGMAGLHASRCAMAGTMLTAAIPGVPGI